MYEGESTEQVEHTANHSPAQVLWTCHFNFALEPQFFPGLLVSQAQVPRGHQIQSLVKIGLCRVKIVVCNQSESPASLALFCKQGQSLRYGHPKKMHRGTGSTWELGGGSLTLNVPGGEGNFNKTLLYSSNSRLN